MSLFPSHQTNIYIEFHWSEEEQKKKPLVER